jgi:hypothetical protein
MGVYLFSGISRAVSLFEGICFPLLRCFLLSLFSLLFMGYGVGGMGFVLIDDEMLGCAGWLGIPVVGGLGGSENWGC